MQRKQEIHPPVRLFLSYAPEDEQLRAQLDNHLRLLQRQGLISTWHNRQILVGSAQAEEIDKQLNMASIILLLVSSDFLKSDYCYSVEMQRALERAKQNEAYVIPILLRPVEWQDAPFRDLPSLPQKNKPVTTWPNPDEAFSEIASGIRSAARQIHNAADRKHLPPLKTSAFSDPYAQQFFEISNPNGEQQVYRMIQGQNQVTVGRAGDEPNDITLGPNNCAYISRRHCLLLKRDGKWWLVPKGGNPPLIRRKTGVKEEVHTERKLADGDTICILGETSPKGDMFWSIRFCDGATTRPASTVLGDRTEDDNIKLTSSKPSQGVRLKLLNRVRDFWIKPMLEDPFRTTDLLTLRLQTEPKAKANPWRLQAQETEGSSYFFPPNTRITDIYDDFNGRLLILGEPGAGKTTLLSELARNLLERALVDSTCPMPVVFHLYSWTSHRKTIVEWMLDELYEKYQVLYGLGKSWLAEKQILPLFDGLDEVASRYRTDCVCMLNTYQTEHDFPPLVVCSRTQEYLAQPHRLTLDQAVSIQPLTTQQIDTYLSIEEFASARDVLRQDRALQELIRTPLMLNVFTLAYKDVVSTDKRPLSSAHDYRQQLFALYVERALLRREHKHYSPQQITSQLTWLAQRLNNHSQKIFYLERIQIDWLPNKWLRLFALPAFLGIVHGLLVGLIFGLFNGALYGASFGYTVGTILGIFIALLYVAINSFLLVSSVEEPQLPQSHIRIGSWCKTVLSVSTLLKKRFIYGCVFGCFGGLLNGLVFGTLDAPSLPWLSTRMAYGLFYGIFFGVIFGLLGTSHKHIQPVEIIGWSWSQFRRQLLPLIGCALLLGLSYGLLYQQSARFLLGLLAGLVFVLLGGIAYAPLENVQLRSPNQGMWRSARNSLISGGIVGFGAALLFSFVFALFYGPLDGLIDGFTSGSIIGLYVLLQYGGITCLLYLVVRLFLWRAGAIPWRYARFLDDVAKQILLIKVGGGYIFLHDLFQQYFADLDGKQTSPYPEMVRPSRRSVVLGLAAGAIGGGMTVLLTEALQTIPASLQPGMPLYIYQKHTSPVFCVACSPDGQYVASGSADRTVQIWNALNGKQILIHQEHTKTVIVLAWSPDGKYIASGSDDGTIQIWDVKQRSHLLTYRDHVGSGSASGIAWSPDGRYIASGSGSGANGVGLFRIWNSMDGDTITTSPFARIIVGRTAWSPNGAYIALACSDSIVRIWGVTTRDLVWTLSGHTGPVTDVVWAPDGTRIASSSLDTTSRIWSVKEQNTLYTLHNNGLAVYSLSWSPNSHGLVTGGIHGIAPQFSMFVWNTLDGKQTLAHAGTDGRIYGVSWSPNGLFIAAASSDNTVQIWKAPNV